MSGLGGRYKTLRYKNLKQFTRKERITTSLGAQGGSLTYIYKLANDITAWLSNCSVERQWGRRPLSPANTTPKLK